jgi:hypothetical protein
MCAATVLSLAALIGAPTAPASSPDPKMADLVRKLGDKSYRSRESAARELLHNGSAAVEALARGTKDADPEVSERCRQLLPQAASMERTEKLATLVKYPDIAPPKGLAGLEHFLKVAGDSKAARELYAEMLAIHFETLETIDENPRKAAEFYQQFCNDAYNRYYAGARTGRYSYDNLFNSRADITYFLIMSSDTRLRKNMNGFVNSWVLLYGNQVTKALTDGDAKEPMRKLFLDFLGSDLDPNLQQRGFAIAAQLKMKEALPIIQKLLEKPGRADFAKANVMIALVGLGSKDDIRILEPYLSDKTQLTTVNFGNGGQTSIQIRDVAMGVSALLAGQKLTDYGFDNRFGGGTPSSYIFFGFLENPDGKENKSREEAHAKWKEWAEKNLPKKK